MKRTIIVPVAAASALLAAVLLILAGGPPVPVTAHAARDRAVTPTVLAVQPRQAPNNLDTTLIITGADFEAVVSGTAVIIPPGVSLGEAALPEVGWVSSTLLTAAVPWGEDPGLYTVTVANPEGGIGSLARAFTVERAIGVWTTGGPYGGTIGDVAVSPVTSATAFAAVNGVGLYRTRDGGDWWELVVGDQGADGVTYGPTNRVFYWGNSLWWSENGGDDWEVLWPDVTHACALDPQDPQRVWMAGGGGVSLLTILSEGSVEQEWRSDGLPADTGVGLLAVDPVSPTILYAGTWDGRVYRTMDGGDKWVEASDGLGPSHYHHSAQALAVNPHDPQVLLYSRWHTLEPGFWSDNRGDTWTPVTGSEDLGGITDLVFSPHVSGTVYASLMGSSLMAVSEDGGHTWSGMGGPRPGDWMLSLGLDSTSGLPAYAGGGASGTYRSEDGGATWTRATEGIKGLPVEDLVAASAQPDTVRVACEQAGAFASENAGQSWRRLPLSHAMASAVAINPVDPGVTYVASGSGIYWIGDGGDWEHAYLPMSQNLFIQSLDVSPVSPSVVYAGGRDDGAFWDDRSVGFVARSDDGGSSWSLLDVGSTISAVHDIAIAPSPTETVYVATPRWAPPGPVSGRGVGVFRSEGGGITWTRVLSNPVHALAIRPDDARTIYAAGMLTDAGDPVVFKSQDGGDSWAPTPLQLTWGGVADLAIDPLAPETVYAGTDVGLYRTIDGGATWTRATGSFGNASIQKLAVAAADGRTILYAGTIGGVAVTGSTTQHIDFLTTMDEAYVEPGVYQLTIDHRPPVGVVYMPLILRGR